MPALPRQDGFSTVFYSMVRAMIMMIGEFDFDDTFHPQDPDDDVTYEGTTYTLFIFFAILVSIIVMNLLVSVCA